MCSFAQGISEVHSFPVGGQLIRIPVSVFWLRPSTKDIYKTVENSYSNSTSHKYSGHNLSGRHASYESNSRKLENGTRHVDLSAATAGVHNKYKEICSAPLPENRVSRTRNRLCEHDTEITSGKGDSISTTMSGGTRETTNDIVEINQLSRESRFNSTSSATSISSGTVSSATTDRGYEEGMLLPRSCETQPELSWGGEMVDKQPAAFQWEVIVNSKITSPNSNRCITKRVGSILSGDFSTGSVVKAGVRPPHKYLGAQSNTFSSSEIFKNVSNKVIPYSAGQHDSIVISSENGGNSQPGTNIYGKRNLDFPHFQRDHNYCRVSPRNIECQSGLGFSTLPRLQRVVTLSQAFSKINSEVGSAGYGPVCIKALPSTTNLHVMETRPAEHSNRCSATEVVQSLPICIPTILPHRSSFSQSEGRKSDDDTGNPKLANTVMVQPNTGFVCRKSSIATPGTRSLDKPSGEESFSSFKQHSKVSGMENLRQNMANEGVSERASKLIIAAKRSSSISNYESAWRKWVGWCNQRQIDPTKCSINFILDYLAYLFELKYEYSTINSHRSAISAYHECINNIPVGQHVRVCELMTGVFNNNPPKPRYVFIWDVEQVVTYIQKLPPNEELNDQRLILKLAVLLALTSAGRGHEIKFLDVRYMVKTQSSYILHFSKVTKSWKRGKPPPEVEFYEFPTNKNLCVVTTLDEYLRRSQEWRSGVKFQLLLSHIKPHNEVKQSTIAGWVKAVMRDAGIDISKFKAHSCRSASTSKAKVMGLSLDDILKRGQWSGKST